MNEESEILEELREVQDTIADWRAAEDFFDGDRGFQRLLERESALSERLAAIRARE